jgi:hypothetical protein
MVWEGAFRLEIKYPFVIGALDMLAVRYVLDRD